MKFDLIMKYAVSAKWEAFRLSQIKTLIFKNFIDSWEKAAVLPANMRAELVKNFPILSFTTEKILISGDNKASKALLRLADGVKIETVLVRSAMDTFTVCVSTQAGCPLGCVFCATGKAGYKRDLTAEEICDQVLFWLQIMKNEIPSARIGSVVYMGMGEPFLNYQAVAESLKTLSDPVFFGIGQRHISVSTAGIAPSIVKFADDFPQMNLAVSLHSADDKKRNRLVPLNQKFNLKDISDALEKYIKKTNRKVFIEYALMEGINDSREDAGNLAGWIRRIKGGRLLHVNLIPCNPLSLNGEMTSMVRVSGFMNLLQDMRVSVTVRKSFGADIMGACGQLAGAE